MNEYIILELIPTSSNPDKGDIIQLSALKLKGLNLIDRFDYRIIDDKVPLKELLNLISYDKENFIYKESTKEILEDFKKWSKNYTLLVIDNSYTLNYLSDLDNKKESIFMHLDMEYHDDIIDSIIKKYNLEPSDHVTDLLYEALIYEDKES